MKSFKEIYKKLNENIEDFPSELLINYKGDDLLFKLDKVEDNQLFYKWNIIWSEGRSELFIIVNLNSKDVYLYLGLDDKLHLMDSAHLVTLNATTLLNYIDDIFSQNSKQLDIIIHGEDSKKTNDKYIKKHISKGR